MIQVKSKKNHLYHHWYIDQMFVTLLCNFCDMFILHIIFFKKKHIAVYFRIWFSPAKNT